MQHFTNTTTISPDLAVKNNLKSLSKSHTDSPELLELMTKLESWRKNKKSKFEPIPESFKPSIISLIDSGQFTNGFLSNKLKISTQQLKKFKEQFLDTQKQQTFQDFPDMLPFKLVPQVPNNPKDFATSASNPTNSSTSPNTDAALQEHPLLNQNITKNDDANANANSSSNCIIINKHNGDNLSLPAHLHNDLTFNIIHAFLCSK